jgi:hypothetical protein
MPPGGAALPGAPWKLMAALGVAGAVGWMLLSGSSVSPEQKDSGRSAVPAPVVAVEAKTQEPSSGQELKSQEQPTVVVEVPPRRLENAQTAAAASPPTSGSNRPDPFADEIAHLGSLRQVYRTNPTAAIGLAREGHKKFPQGMLYEEREALLILALSQAGQSDEAGQRAVDFRARFPRSAFISKMRQMVPAAKEPPGVPE